MVEHLDTIGKRIRHMRNLRGLTQGQLADELSITPANISSYERDKSVPPSDVLGKIADILLTSADYLLLRENSYTTLYHAERTVPLVGAICAGNGFIAEERIEDYVSYPFPKKKQPDYALRVQGNSMIEAGINSGDIVFLRKEKWAEYNGQIVAVIINGEEGILKRMKWFEGSPYIRLEPENKDYEAIDVLPSDIIVCGVYAGHFRSDELFN